VTEHQSTLDRVFSQPGGVAAYEEVVEKSAAFICVSEHLRRRIADVIDPTKAGKIETVPNIVDLSDITFRERARGRLQNWIYVGTIATHKGAELLAKAFKIYRERNREASLTIVGDGPLRQWVERFAAGSGMSKAVRLVGSVPHDRVGAYLDEADVLVHLSEGETFGISTLEAIGAGLPVISRRNGGAESAWGDFEKAAGRLLPEEVSASEVAEAVTALEMNGSDLDPRLARAMVEERFSPRRVASELAEIYTRVR
jgi:glycogen(starch) synthase